VAKSAVVCSYVADALGLVEGRDYTRVCMGERGFDAVIQDLSEYATRQNKTLRPAQYCDISAQTITVTKERTGALGIHASRRTYRGHLATLVIASLQRRGIWAFMQPLEWRVWVMLLATILAVPFILIALDSMFSTRCGLCHHRV
jgi:hypothetical protein